MTDNSTPAQTGQAGVGDAQLRVVLYYAVGATEGAKQPYHLSIAADRLSPHEIQPTGNSGYTVGMMQTDLGSHHQVADDLVDRYQDWARRNHQAVFDTQAEHKLRADLQRTGAVINAQGHHDIPSDQKNHLNTFLASGEGQSWVQQQDMNQLTALMDKAVKPMQGTPLYKSVSADEQQRLAVVAAKAYNQRPADYPYVQAHAEDRKNHTVDDFVAAVKRDTGHINNQVRNDIPKAQQSANVVLALQHAPDSNPLKAMWLQEAARTAQSPEAPPQNAQAQAVAQAQHATLTNLFANYDGNRVDAFIKALDQGQPYPDMVRDQRLSLVTDGHNLVTLDHVGPDGHGYALTDGHWMAVEHDQLHWHKNQDHTHDLQLTTPDGQPQTLLHTPAPQHQPQHQQVHQPSLAPAHQPVSHYPAPASAPDPGHPAMQPPGSQLDRTQRQEPAYPASDPRNPGNPEHAMYQSVHDQLVALHDTQGLKLAPESLDRCTAAVMADARAADMRSVTRMMFLEPNGQIDTSRIGITDGDRNNDARNFNTTDLNRAANTPAEQSFQQFAQNTQALDQPIQQMQQLRMAELQQAQGMSMSLSR
jgi:hypothetical protein